jgi:DNA-binding Xre family transcriptional regulator
MPTNKRTIYLGLDYSQFSGGITDINRKMGLLDAEFKLATQQAKNYGTETDQLGLKTEYLTQKIALQNQKVEAAKKAYDDAMSSQSASAKEIDTLDQKLLNERLKLEQLSGQLEQNKKDTDKATGANKSFGDEIRGVAESIGLNVSPALEKLAKKFDGVSAAVGNAVLGIGAMVGGLLKCTKAAADNADELLTLADKTGITTDELQKLQYVSKFVDVEFSTLTGEMDKLERSMISARDGSKDASEAFKKLHIRVKDSRGALRDQTEVFWEAIDALGKVKNETERDALAMQLFGKSAKELNPLIKAGSEEVNRLKEEFDELGLGMSGENLEKLSTLKDSWIRLDEVWTNVKNNLGLALLPILTTLFEAISKIPEPVLRTLVVFAGIVASIVLVVKAIKSMTDTASTITKFFKGFDTASLKTTAIIMGVVVALIALAAIIAVIIGKSSELNNSMNSISNMTKGVQEQVTGAQDSYRKTQTAYASRNASGADYYQGGRTWVGEEGPEIVELPRGSRIIPNKQASQISNATNNYYITIDAKNVSDFNRVVDMANQMQMATRRI